MEIKLHKQATTTPKVRAEIQAAPRHITNKQLADRYGVHVSTIRRWRARSDTLDRPHTRHNLLATLIPEQERLLVTLREVLRLGLDDLLMIAKTFLHPELTRSSLHRMLKRHKVATLSSLNRRIVESAEELPHQALAAREPGLIYISIRKLPPLSQGDNQAQGDSLEFLYVACDWATHWVHAEPLENGSAESLEIFLKHLVDAAPFAPHTLLINQADSPQPRGGSGKRHGKIINGTTSRLEDLGLCHGIKCLLVDHEPSTPHGKQQAAPSPNGLALEKIFTTSHYKRGHSLAEMLQHFCQLYNQRLPQKGLHQKTPLQAIAACQQDHRA